MCLLHEAPRGVYHYRCGYPQALSTMGMNNTRVIRSPTGCWPSNVCDRKPAHNGGDCAYRHRIVSNNPLIMKANAMA